MNHRHVIGCMSGTSCDGIDASLVQIEGSGLDLRATHIRSANTDLGRLGDRLMAFARGGVCTAGEIAQMAAELSKAHAEVIRETLSGLPCDLIAVHGQTVFHAPPLGWQLIEPSIIAEAVGAPVVCGLRGGDLARGGQGAPITPIADWVLLRAAEESRAVVNLGGFSNATILPADAPAHDTQGFDVCACNQLLDTLARLAIDEPYDHDGRVALTGTVDPVIHAKLADRLSAQAGARRSLGSRDEPGSAGDGWADLLHDCVRSADAADVLRSAAKAIATVVAQSEVVGTDRVLLAGGGVMNAALQCELRDALPAPVVTTDHAGVPARYREAIAMATLGALCADGVPITLPNVTGCGQPAPVAGVWTGGSFTPTRNDQRSAKP